MDALPHVRSAMALGREGLKYAIEEMTELRLLIFNLQST